MEELFKNNILKELFETRGDSFESEYIKLYGESKEIVKSKEKEESLTNTIKKKVKDEEELCEILNQLNEFQGALIGEMCFWNEQYYKLGFLDFMYLKKELVAIKEKFSKEKEKDTSKEDNFFNNCIDDFMDYFDQKTYTDLSNRAYEYSQRNSEENYMGIIENAYYGISSKNDFKSTKVRNEGKGKIAKKEGEGVCKDENSNSKHMGNIK